MGLKMTYPENSANIRVKDIMTTEVITIDAEETVLKAVGLMTEKEISSLLVTKGDKEVGIITERDIMSKVIAEKRDLETVKVKDIMSTSNLSPGLILSPPTKIFI